MPDTYAAEPRTTLGKSVARLRRNGVVPANIYGRDIESTAVQIVTRDAAALLRTHGLNTLVNLEVAGESAPRSVVVRSTQRHPVNQALQHVDFYQVDLNRTMQAHLPVVVTGEAPAIAMYKGVLIHGLDNVLVEGLPAQMPTHLEISVDGLAELESEVKVSDLKLPAGVSVLTNGDIMLARVSGGRAASEAAAVPEGEQPAS
ncbi:MAG: 50S ribosomal protein L25 [Chloroflexi bacterium]|nr:MAG: 50S ribosomal protein L25 [Chloroflexota bacterium]